jgi:hypothetical protein
VSYFLEMMYDVLFRPAEAMREIGGGGKLKQSLAAFLLSLFVPLWIMHVGLAAAGMAGFIPVLVAIQTAGSVVVWFTGAALLALTAEVFGGRGSAAGLFAAMGFAQIPRLFLVPLWVFAVLLPYGIRPLALAGTAFLIFIWTLYLDVLALKGTYHISGSKAILVMLFPVIAIMLLGLLTGAVIGVSVLNAMPIHW